MLISWPIYTVTILDTTSSPAAALFVVVVPGWAFALAATRASTMGVRVSAEGIRVRNLLRTRDVGWDEIAGFSMGRTTLLPVVGMLELVDGSSIPISGIQPRNILFFPGDRAAHQLVEQLNTELVAQRGSARRPENAVLPK